MENFGKRGSTAHNFIVIMDIILAILITVSSFILINSQVGLLVLLFALGIIIATIYFKAAFN